MSNLNLKIIDVRSIKKTKNIKSHVETIQHVFGVNDTVLHKEDKIKGKISHIGESRVAIIWEDGTKERIKIASLKDEIEYVDDVQTQVSPVPESSQITCIEQDTKSIEASIEKQLKKEIDGICEDTIKKTTTDDLFDNAMDILNTIDSEDDGIIIEDGSKPLSNLPELKMDRAINEQKYKTQKTKDKKIKNKLAESTIKKAIEKGIIEQDDYDIEIQKILSMTDSEFKQFEDKINNEDNLSSSINIESHKENEIEADEALQKIKDNGGKGTIGDFSSHIKKSLPNINNIKINSDDTGTRSLQSIANKGSKITFDNQYVLPSFDEQFSNILSENITIEETLSHNVTPQKKVVAKKESIINPPEESLNLSGFKDIQGLKKPMVITSTAMEHPGNTNIKDLFQGMNWTIVSKKK